MSFILRFWLNEDEATHISDFRLREGITVMGNGTEILGNMQARYPVITGDAFFERHSVGGILFNDKRVSKLHGRFNRRGTEVSYLDAGSTNGTYASKGETSVKLNPNRWYSMRHRDLLLLVPSENTFQYAIELIDTTIPYTIDQVR